MSLAAGRRALVMPVRNAAGELFYLSVGQRVTLSYLFHRVRAGRVIKLREAAATMGTTAGVMSKRLDRLASLGLIGRQSHRGRSGRTVLWIPTPRRVAMRRMVRELGCTCSRCLGWTGNVPTSTPRGFITRERLTGQPAGIGGGTPRRGAPEPKPRRIPPRVLFSRCPSGHMAHINRTGYSESGGTVRASWSGYCRCGSLVRDAVEYRLPGALRRPVPISEVLGSWRL